MNIANNQESFRRKWVVVWNMRMVKRQRPNYWNQCRDYTDLQEQNNHMICIAFTCSLDLYNTLNLIVNQTFSIMNKSFFKVKKHIVPPGSWGCHTITCSRLKLFRSLVMFTLLYFLHLEILINFFGNKKNCVFY